MPVHSLFPIPIGLYELDALSEAQHDWVVGLPTIPNEQNRISDSKYVLDTEPMAPVRAQIEAHLMQYFREVYTDSTALGLRITQSWCNYTGVGEAHHKHDHPNSVVSGVYYPQTTDEDSITFYNTRLESRTLRPTTSTFNEFNSSSWWLPTTQGSLLLFPSDLPHSVSPREDASAPDRISLSFNTFYAGEIGDVEGADHLSLP